MMKLKQTILTSLVAALCWATPWNAAAKVEVGGLTCEQEPCPLGVETASPGFGWKLESDETNVVQTAWQLEVASTRQALVEGKADWSSQKEISSEQIHAHVKEFTFAPAQRYWWRVRVWTEQGPTQWSDPSWFVSGLKEWDAQWISRPWPDSVQPLPYFRKTFELTQSVQELECATAYLCGLGCGELYVNGAQADSRFLDPAQTNYEQYALYSTLDVTSLMQEGKNCVGVMLGDGWYNQDQVWGGGFAYGKPLLIAQLVFHYRDGSTQCVGTGPEWEWRDGPVLRSNIYAGEVYDARKEVEGWCQTDGASEGWSKAILAPQHPPRLVSQLMQPMRPQEERTAVRVLKSGEEKWIFDFGENITGFPQISVEQPAGTHLVMKVCENLDEKGQMDYRSTGVFATGVVQSDEYICKGGGRETWHPRFTYHGFRFLELSGQVGTPDASWVRAVPMHSDVAQRGTFACSDAQINRLHQMALRTVYNNLQGIPTDCPHRERCGWLGDTHAYVKMANLNLGMQNFWDKYLRDIRSCAQKQLSYELFHQSGNTNFYYGAKPAGLPFMIAPGKRLCGVASPDWGTALVQLPWNLYVYYGNREKLAEFYPDMKRWVDTISLITQGGLVKQGLGDWCPPGGNHLIDCPIEFSSSAFHYLDLKIMAAAAQALGKSEDAAFYGGQCPYVKKAMVAKFYDAEKGSFGSQTANAMALDLGLFPEGQEPRGAEAIVKDMNEKHSGFMHCGIFGLSRLGNALSDYGYGEEAWKFFTKKGSPSFATMWEKWDATTLWEVLPVAENTPPAETDSKSHPMQGGYDSWFYESVAGIRPDAQAPGFKHILFKPQVCEYLDWASASLETAYGKAAIDWKKEGDLLTYTLVIPPSTTGSVDLPPGAKVTLNGQPLDATSGVCHLGSGHYVLKITQAPVDAEGDCFVAAYYFPNYHPSDPRNAKNKGEGWSEWEVVKKAQPRFEGQYQPRVPLWGYSDESDPQVMAQKIDAAADHGINAFIFDWYYYEDGPFLERGLEKGFLQAPNRERLKFALMWANHDWVDVHPWKYCNPWVWKLLYPGKVSEEAFERMCDYIIETYFKAPGYWQIEGKPYFSIYELSKLMESFGSVEATRAALDRFREKTVAAGFAGLHLNAVVWGKPVLPQEKGVADPQELMKELAFDSVTSYVWVHHVGLKDFPATDYNYARDEYLKYWDEAEKDFSIPYYPNVTVGWDGFPRSDPADPLMEENPFQRAISNNTPERVQEVIKITRNRLKQRPASQRIFNINSWNEWTEGSYLEPDQRYGMKYLEAVRDGK